MRKNPALRVRIGASMLDRTGAVCLCLMLAACSGSNNNETNRNLDGRDARADAHDEADADPADDERDAAEERDTSTEQPSDAGELLDATSTLDASDAAVMADSSLDAMPAQDAASDSGAQDAAADSETDAARNVIYATFNSTLVRIDPDTGKLTTVGTLRNVEDAGQTFSDVVMTWTGEGDTAWMVSSYYQTPTLAKANLCTATVQLGPRFVRPNSPNLVVEGLALHPNGNFYVSSGNPATVTSPISSNLGTLDASTGAITDLGVSVTGLQGDIDMLFVQASTLYGVDVTTNNGRLGLFTLNLETGKDTQVVAPNYGAMNMVPLRVAYDASRKKAFSWRPSDRNLLTFDLDAGSVAPIGETHSGDAGLGDVVRGFFVAPAPNCPPQDN